MHEAIIALALKMNVWGFQDTMNPEQRIQQINCSICLKSIDEENYVDLYYM